MSLEIFVDLNKAVDEFYLTNLIVIVFKMSEMSDLDLIYLYVSINYYELGLIEIICGVLQGSVLGCIFSALYKLP